MKLKSLLLPAILLFAVVGLAAGTYQRAQGHGTSLVGEPASAAKLSLPADALRYELADALPGFAALKAEPTCFDCHHDRMAEAVLPASAVSAPAPGVAHSSTAGWLLSLLLGFGVLGTVAAAPTKIDERTGKRRYYPLAAATKIYQGALVAVDTSGNAVNAADTAGLRVIGRAEETIDNTTGSAGDLYLNVETGVFKYVNSGTQAVDADDKGKFAYVEDNLTVAETSTHKVKAGLIVDLDDSGASVWVDTNQAQVVPVALAVTSAQGSALTSTQNSTTGASDPTTTQNLANALKTSYNALQADVAALLASYNAAQVDIAALRAALLTQGEVK